MSVQARRRDYAETVTELSTSSAPPIRGVIFDFHLTLVDGGDPDAWLADAYRLLGRDPSGQVPDVAGLAAYLDRIWEHADSIDRDSERDLDAGRHRDVFSRTVARYPGVDADLVDALYDTMVDQWVAFDDTFPVLSKLSSRGVPIAVLSNVGIDIRRSLERAGVASLIESVVLSYEVGVVKPDPRIFEHTLGELGLPANQALMVGDSARADVGGASLGLRTLILPRTSGPVHGLHAVLDLIG
jgi:HAD superfamily hydrolase (TIGR01509 family)